MYLLCLEALNGYWIQNRSTLVICNDLLKCFRLLCLYERYFYYVNNQWFLLWRAKIFWPRTTLADARALIASNYIMSWRRHTIILDISQMVFQLPISVLLLQRDQGLPKCLFLFPGSLIYSINRDFF